MSIIKIVANFSNIYLTESCNSKYTQRILRIYYRKILESTFRSRLLYNFSKGKMRRQSSYTEACHTIIVYSNIFVRIEAWNSKVRNQIFHSIVRWPTNWLHSLRSHFLQTPQYRISMHDSEYTESRFILSSHIIILIIIESIFLEAKLKRGCLSAS